MLGAGFFTTQKSQETVYSAVGQSSTNLEVSGPIVLLSKSDSSGYEWANFTLIMAAGGSPVDMSKVVYTISTKDSFKELSYGDVSDAMNWHNDNGNNLLERGEILEIGISETNGASFIKANQQFTIEVKPAVGAALPITRTAPLSIGESTYYEVY
jgi:flagellin FlaB